MALASRLCFSGLALALIVAAGTGPAGAADAQPRWAVSASTATGTPTVLSHGLALGAMAEINRRLGHGPLFLSGRAGWMEASAANESWIIDHHHFTAAVGAGVAGTLGVGRVWAQIGGGATGLYELLSRHQRQRIESAGVSGAVETTFTAGPCGFAEVGVGVHLRGRVSGFLAAGPTLAWTQVNSGPLLRWGGAARMGVAYDF